MLSLRVAEAVRRAALPAYVYDLREMRAHVGDMMSGLPPGVRLFYAVKANAHPAVLAALESVAVDGFEIASGGELARVPAGQPMIFNGPGKTDDEIERALRAGVTYINAESLHDLDRLANAGSRLGVTVPVLLRVNPAALPVGGSHRMAGAATQFGIDAAAVEEAVRRSRPPIALKGIHVHAVSNNLSAEDHLSLVRYGVAFARSLGLPVVDVGGGIGIDYSGDGNHFDWPAFASGLDSVGLSPDMSLIVEPGRFLVARCGYYAAPVLDVKENHGKAFAVLRGGSHHFRLPAAMKWSHPFDIVPVDAWPYPFERPSVSGPVTIAGELCTTSDVLARDVPVSALRAGDIVVFSLAGAYAWEISHDRFLSHPRPRTIILT